MDPRPYHYQYRRPRLNNPTFESINLYESLYHRGVKNSSENNISPTLIKKNQFQSQLDQASYIYKSQSIPKKSSNSFIIETSKPTKHQKLSNSVIFNSNNPQTYLRPMSNHSVLNKHNNSQNKSSILASYGQSSMDNESRKNSGLYRSREKNQSKIGLISNLNQNYDHLNRFSIYQKQQKPFNIIGNYPRQSSTELRKYPKYTLQNKLIESGRYNPY